MTALLNELGGQIGFGDLALGSNDDSSTGLIDVSSIFPSGLNFFGQTYTGLFINNNGGITFNEPRGTFTQMQLRLRLVTPRSRRFSLTWIPGAARPTRRPAAPRKAPTSSI